MKSYVEHVALPVADIEWSVQFFGEVFGMYELRRREEPNIPKQVWLRGGIQLTDRSSGKEAGWPHHLGLVVSDLETAMYKALSFAGVRLLEGAPAKWLELPDGTVLELFQAKAEAVEKVLSANGIDRAATEKLKLSFK